MSDVHWINALFKDIRMARSASLHRSLKNGHDVLAELIMSDHNESSGRVDWCDSIVNKRDVLELDGKFFIRDERGNSIEYYFEPYEW